MTAPDESGTFARLDADEPAAADLACGCAKVTVCDDAPLLGSFVCPVCQQVTTLAGDVTVGWW